ncbi:glycerophosphoryl diester phosphodiesterase [Tothia fuscella]|uniref:glycerophosphodiester phosphodiesterase n=1 Tax=Tothia fuscella TaxID=1048955 RepID=A0A9P4NR11_9PEZI|nr:glycerophosphoryl diester phosphodiesterase [Tothia fuscella]
MRGTFSAAAALLVNGASALPSYSYSPHTKIEAPTPAAPYYVSLGPRPYYLINNMTEGPLKKKLQSCENGPFAISSWSIGHRGGSVLQFPEETEEATFAGARMGAGVLECDVAFTSDLGLVCRHSQCDLHTTTNILLRPELARKCTVPFTPANRTSPANALCCTSDITTAEYKSLCGKQDGFNASAVNVRDYQSGTAKWRTELYDQCGTVQTLDGYIKLVNALPGYRNFTPELKTPPAQVPMPFKGYTQEQYARDLVNAFIKNGIDPSRVWLQSFLPADVFQWIKEFPVFGKQAVYLDEAGETPATLVTAIARLPSLKARGVNIVAPPIPYLLRAGGPNNDTIVPAAYGLAAKAAGLDIITWSFERSAPFAQIGASEYYYAPLVNLTNKFDGRLFEVIDVLAQQVGVVGLFSDWSAAVTYYANCLNVQGPNSAKYQAIKA